MLKRLGYVDFLNGSILKNMIIFTVPLVLTSIIQLLFNAADIMVVGKFSSDTALAAVTSTSALIALIINFFIGLSVGTNVVVARNVGANDADAASKAVHTAILLALIGGIFAGTLGFCISRWALELMDTPDDVIEQATSYIRIYFIGAPGMLLYNFGSSVLRSIGDSKRPLYFMSAAGVVNIILNLVTVIVFKLDATGVAIATTASNYMAGALTLLSLTKEDGMCRLNLKSLKLHAKSALEIIRIGVPSGIQSCLFSISNTLIQSTVNSFGSTVMSANGVSQNIESFVFTALSTASQASMTFTSQNLGARKKERLRPSFYNSLVLGFILWLVMGGVIFLTRYPIMSLYTNSSEVIDFAIKRFYIMIPSYILCGYMDITTSCLRGLGSSTPPMIVTVLCVCGLRVAWIYTIFKAFGSLESIYISYPISWTIAFAVNTVLYFIISRKTLKSE